MIRALWQIIPTELRGKARSYLALVVIGCILNAVAIISLVPLISELFGAQPSKSLIWLAVLAAATVLSWAVDGIAKRLSNDAAFATLHSAQHRLADHIAEVRTQWLTSENTATTKQVIGTAGFDLVSFLSHMVTPVITAFVLPPMIAIGLLFVSVPLGVTALIAIPVVWLAFWATSKFTRRADAQFAHANAELADSLSEFARSQPALRSSRRAATEQSRVSAALSRQDGSLRRLIGLQVPGQVLFSLAIQTTLLAIMVVIAWQFTSGAITAALAIGLLVAGVRFVDAISDLSRVAAASESATGALSRLKAVLAAPKQPVGDTAVTVTTAPRLRLENVGFAYDSGERVFENLSIDFAPGSTTAIVGPSGSGKSTVLALLAGLETPTSGQITVDDNDLQTLTAGARRDLVTVVFQHPFLFDGTVAENIALEQEADIAAAAALARVTPSLDLAQSVGERGSKLSGGERQRVSIARALAKPAPVLLVDEATSALDNDNERAVAAALVNDPIVRTRVIVAHRLSSIREADRVLFLENGAIVEDGTVDELLRLGGRFATFWKHQELAADFTFNQR